MKVTIGQINTTSGDIDIERWYRTAASRDVIFETGDRFSFENRMLPYIRVGYAGYRESELAEAVRLLASALCDARDPKQLTAAS